MKKDVGTPTGLLKIRPLPPPPNKTKISFKLPVPLVDTFHSYLGAYAEIYGVAADPDFVAERIFSSFFESDRAFAAYLEKTAEGSGAPVLPQPKEPAAKTSEQGTTAT